jgi:hypothetical protein
MEERIARLEGQLKQLWLYCAVLTLTIVALVASGFRSQVMHDKVLRAQGLIIEDSQGKERILIGAPIPFAQNRVRTDLARVKQLWAPRFPSQYMDWYQGYQHSMNGVLILDRKGFDRVALGDPVPDPNVGKRIGPSTGLEINDEQGFERSGIGLLTLGKQYRAVLGFDHAEAQGGAEGATLSLDDGGEVALEIGDADRRIYIGTAPDSSGITGKTGPFQGIALTQGKQVKYEINEASKK